jgi:hypothetical protein
MQMRCVRCRFPMERQCVQALTDSDCCEMCGGVSWEYPPGGDRSLDAPDTPPRVPWALTKKDREFLRQLAVCGESSET